ncbi:MAG: hypothetical protein ACREQT_10750 [Candidatus Binataceae bacterium]
MKATAIGSTAVFLALIAFGLETGVSSAATTQSWPIEGIYAVNSTYVQYVRGSGLQIKINSDVLSNSNVDGVAVHVGWNQVETSDGVYSWGALDNAVSQAGGSGKKVTLDVIPGWQTPSWVYTEGAKGFNFIWANNGWGPPLCSVVTIPVPWDTVYTAKWTAFVQAFGAHYDTNATVAAVKILGVNSDDEETRLPYNDSATIKNGTTSCVSYDDVADWQAIGYTRLVVESAWEQIAAAYQSAFPDKALVAVLNVGGFPPIDDNGNIFTGKYGQDSQTSTDLIAYGVANYGSQFALQNDGLGGTTIWSTEESYANQMTTGYQTVSALGRSLGAAMSLAVKGGAEYLELYDGDLDNSSLQSTIATYRSELP